MEKKERITEDSRIVINDALHTSLIDNELMIMSLERGEYYGIDSIGSDIFQRISKPISVKELCLELIENYEVSFDTCVNDVLVFLEEMKARDIIKILV